MSIVQLKHSRSALFGIFCLSGFSGLIYESVWTQYLKLFLGHAAYAQTLVLVIFMGGLAVGSSLASRYSAGWKNLLVAYALVEGLIGVAALLFHQSFVAAADFTYDHLLPGIGAVPVAQAIKWGLATAFILPQSILLGMTFPLMSGGLIRRFPATPGASLALLYFSNSFGAALGVLASGFVFIARFGLPGTILVAGLINVAIAMSVWLLTKDQTESPPQLPHVAANQSGLDFAAATMLGAAFVTGAASFLYEIAWIRGLSLVLGSSTHSFELMLSAFILGLALGGLWIRRSIDRLNSPGKLLGYVQVAMGVFALATLPLFGSAFEMMQYILTAVTRTEQGYALFHLSSHALCLLVMLPATICAGMTLPLMTYLLLRKGQGERAIGAVYAANTLGAIFGVILGVEVLMPLVGVKGLVCVGAALDVALGLALLRSAWGQLRRFQFAVPALTAACALALTVALVQLDPKQLLSGVFRGAEASLPKDASVLLLKDGKTATIGLVRFPGGLVTISTNGKPDAALYLDGRESHLDEATMIVAGALGLAYHPSAKSAANIGFGSGLTSHVLLSTSQLESLDTVEIESYMVEAARGYGARVERAFSDPRSKVYIEDAKTFFSTRQRRYDLIVTEPSNPWVSGVASLFSQEFYARIGDYLQPGGVLVQWVQLYETDLTIVASIMRALGSQFSDYVVYTANDGDMLIVAWKQGAAGRLNVATLSDPGLARELERIHVRGVEDLEARRIGSKRTLDPLFQSFGVPANSDYFPYVDQNAARARFMQKRSYELMDLTVNALPLIEMLDGAPPSPTTFLHNGQDWLARTRASADAHALRQILLERRFGDVPRTVHPTALLPQLFLEACDRARSQEAWIDAMISLAGALNPYLSREELEPVWRGLESQRCFAKLSPKQLDWFALVRAVGRRDAHAMGALSKQILERGDADGNPGRIRYALKAGMLGYVVSGESSQARLLWDSYGAPALAGEALPVDARLLVTLTRPGAWKTATAEDRARSPSPVPTSN